MARRSCMSVPGSSSRMIASAMTTRADMIIFDLEDAVPVSEKAAARDAVVDAVRSGDWSQRIVGVRVNDWSSAWTLGDVEGLVMGCGARLDVIVLPKVEEGGMVRALDLVLRQLEMRARLPKWIGIEAQIESSRGVQRVEEICDASDRLEAIALGPLDLAASLGIRDASGRGRAWMDPIALALVVAGRSAGVQVIDGPYVRVRDPQGLRSDARWAADLGFDGKWALHPDQVLVLEEVFSPTAEELQAAAQLIEAYEAAATGDGHGAILLDGEMIDEASCRIARRILAKGRPGDREVSLACGRSGGP